MKKKLFLCLACFLAVFALVGILSVTSSAATEEYYTYEVSNGEVTITDVDTAISGDVTIPSTLGGYPVTSIGSGAFRNCTSLTSIEIPSSVTSIGFSAFYGCKSLESITLPFVGASKDGTKKNHFGYIFGASDHWDNEDYVPASLKTVVITGGTSIGSSAFYWCRSLTSIEIPSSVTSIGSAAFHDCTCLTSIEIPTSVTNIGKSAFWGCTSLTSIEIPTSVTSIGEGTFSGCSSLTSITIPSSVTSIGSSAFQICTSLMSVTIPSSVTSIGSFAFQFCTGLTSIAIPSSVTSIGDYAFYGCYKLIEVYNCSCLSIKAGSSGCGHVAYYAKNVYTPTDGNSKLTEKDGFIFYNDNGNYYLMGCKESKTEITLPATINESSYVIYKYAFSGCISLESITVDKSNSVYHSAGDCVIETASKTLVSGCKNSTIPTDGSVISIGDYAFYSCYTLTSITIPKCVRSVGDYAFYDCDSLKTVSFADGSKLASIGSYAFSDCDSLTSITIPSSVTSIGGSAFWNCAILKTVTFAEGSKLKSIGTSAFYNCESLTSIEIPSSVTSIGGDAFEDCDSLKAVYITDIAAWCSISFGNSVANPLSNGGKLYLNEELVTNLVIPEGVTSIGASAFYNCESLTSIEIPSSVTSIGSYAFDSCESLASIEIPSSVTSIGSSAFYDCESLENITLPFVGSSKDGTENTHFGYIFGASSYSSNSSYVPESLKTVVITSGTSIGAYAFYGCDGLTSIEIPSSVTSIGSSAFDGCTSLTSIEILSSVTSIGSNAFKGCKCLASITIPSSVTSIGSYAFSGCTGLKMAIFEEGSKLESIGDHAFYSCGELMSIAIPEGVTSISDAAFWGCTELKTVYVTDIAAWCQISFGNTDANPLSNGGKLYLNGELVTNLIFLDTVTRWDTDAFVGYPNFETVYYRGTSEQWNTIAFESDAANPANYGANIIFNARVYTFFDEDGKTVLKTEIVSVGTAIDAPAPTKQATAQYTYTFAGFEGFESGMTIVDDISFVAKYNATVNKYTYTFLDEDGETVLKELTVDYGTAIITPDIPTKAEDAVYKYTFEKWLGFEDGMTVTENITFKASYTAARKGILALKSTTVKTAWGLIFATEICGTQTAGEGGVFTLVLDELTASLVKVEAADGVTVEREENTLIVTVTRAVEAEEALLFLTAKTSDFLASGEHSFLALKESESASDAFAPLVIFEMGDVNLDGEIDTVDALLIQQHVVGMITLSEVSLAYADTYADEVTDTVDALYIQQSAVGMDVTLGDRVSVTFVETQEEKTYTVRDGHDLTAIPEAPAGYAWSANESAYVAPVYTAIAKSTKYYLVKE